MSVSAFERTLDRLVPALLRSCEVIATAIGLWLAMILFVAVLLRYLLNTSLSWVDESSAILLVWLMLAIAPIGFEKDFHIAVSVLQDRAPRLIRGALTTLVNLLTIAFFAVVFYFGILNTVAEWDTELFSIPFIQRGWVTWPLPLSSLAIVIVCLNKVIKILRHGPPETSSGTL